MYTDSKSLVLGPSAPQKPKRKKSPAVECVDLYVTAHEVVAKRLLDMEVRALGAMGETFLGTARLTRLIGPVAYFEINFSDRGVPLTLRVCYPGENQASPHVDVDGALHSTVAGGDVEYSYFRPDTIYTELVLNSFDTPLTKEMHNAIEKRLKLQNPGAELTFDATVPMPMSIMPPLGISLETIMQNDDTRNPSYNDAFIVTIGLQIARALNNCSGMDAVFTELFDANVFLRAGLYGTEAAAPDTSGDKWRNIHALLIGHESMIHDDVILNSDVAKRKRYVSPEARIGNTGKEHYSKTGVWALGNLLWGMMFRNGDSTVQANAIKYMMHPGQDYEPPITMRMDFLRGVGTRDTKHTVQDWLKVMLLRTIRAFLVYDSTKRPSLEFAVYSMEFLFAALAISYPKAEDTTMRTYDDYVVSIQKNVEHGVPDVSDPPTVYDLLNLGVHGMLDAERITLVVNELEIVLHTLSTDE